MGSPAQPKTATIWRLFRRLQKGPFWLGDWRSTGIRSRSTASNAVQFLYKRGLLKRTLCGHKVLYDLIPHDIFDCKISDWWPYLTTRRRRDRMDRDRDVALKTWVPEFLDKIKPNIMAMGRIGTLRQVTEKNIEINLSNAEIIELLNQVDRSMNYVGTLEKWQEVQSFKICPLCLAERRKFVYTIFDKENGQIICPECGLVVYEDLIIR